MSRCVGPEPGRACLTAALLLLAAGRACADDPAAAAQQAAERDIRALRALFQAGPPEQIVQPPVDNRQQAEQQEQQIAQQAKQLERMLQPILHVELEVIRNACGELERDARQRILTAGRGAVEATAREFARRQFTGGLDGGFDPRGEIRRALEKAVAEAVPPDELAAYRREQEARVARRAAAARLAIISKLDRQLELSGVQRQAIEEHLARAWKPDWARELDDRGGMVVNNYRPAPDYAATSIEPHLSPEQKKEWKKWCAAAGWRVLGRHFGWNFDGQGMQQPDPWWTR